MKQREEREKDGKKLLTCLPSKMNKMDAWIFPCEDSAAVDGRQADETKETSNNCLFR